jgi:hypothetical protein
LYEGKIIAQMPHQALTQFFNSILLLAKLPLLW